VKIGYRTMKTAIAVPISVSVAQLLGGTNVVSAGIVTMLCIESSRKRSYLTAWHRFLACIVAAFYSVLFFELLGTNLLTLAIVLLFFIPTTVYLNVTGGIGTSSVIILQLFSSSERLFFPSLYDTFLVVTVGIGVALIVNLYMPSLDNRLKEQQKELEDNFSVILKEFSNYIRDNRIVWSGKELTEAADILENASTLVERDYENHLLRDSHPYRDYFHMRSRQFELLEKMLPLVTKLPNKNIISEKIADFFADLSESVHPENTAIIYLDELHRLREEIQERELPQTKEEFETRANLHQLLTEMENYLTIKLKYKKSDVKEFKEVKNKDRG